MSDARSAIFTKIKTADAMRGAADADAVRSRLETPPPQIVPAIATPATADMRDKFVTKAIELGCTVADCANLTDVPTKVAAYLLEQEQTPDVTLSSDPEMSALPWETAGLSVNTNIAREALDASTSVTRARAGIVETGAVAVTSGESYPVSLGLLPDRHIIVLNGDDLVGGYEDVWQLARRERDNQGINRALIFVGGPSRTADIEATLVMGAHGPRAVHIIIVG